LIVAQDVVIGGAVVLAFVVLFLFFASRVRAGHSPKLRRIQAFDSLQDLTSRTIETGRPLHLSLGVGSMANASTADSLAGLTILDHLADQAAITGVHPTVTMADPTVMLYAQNRLRAAHQGDARGEKDAYQSVRWLAPQPAAYAAGVMSLMSTDNVQANVMVGRFGDEYLLMGEAAAQKGISQIGGASDPNTLPFVYTTAQESLLGEEIYAAGAYLQKDPARVSSVLAQDTMRWIISLAMLGGVVLASLGWGSP
jgi:hypothetical protein